jgi:hypothetical protein
MPEKREPWGGRHVHTPTRDGEPYFELGAMWHRPVCECGRVLSPRRLGIVHTGGKK